MRSRTSGFAYRLTQSAEASKHWARLNLAKMLPLHAQARGTSRWLPLLLRMERESESLTAAFHGSGSAVRADFAPADAWSSSRAGAQELAAGSLARASR